MELDELKRSWNALDEHLKDKQLINDEEIANLINHAKKKMTEMSRFNQRLGILSFLIIATCTAFFIYRPVFTGIYFQIILVALLPAIGWDIFTSHFFRATKIDEMALVTVISRFNRIHRWIIRERITGIAFMLFMASFLFIQQHVWQQRTEIIILFFVLWAACCALPLWVYRKNLGRLNEIKKNLNELKELKSGE